MPIYEFECEACQANSEILVRSANWRGTPCPKCGSIRLKKKFSTFASSAANGGTNSPPCSGTPRSCGRCGTGVPHSH